MPNLKNKKVIKDQQGQRKYPGLVTEIQGDTMATTGYGDIPLYVVPNVGNPMVVPANSGNRVFPGASSFTEYPIANNGGWLDKYQDGGLKSVTGPAPKLDAKTEAEGKRIASSYNNANKQNAQISQTRNWSQADQEHSDRVKARINNPASDVGILAANMASNLTRFRNLSPEEIARVTDNVGETVNLSSGIATDALTNELVGYGATKAIPFVSKSAKAAGKYLTEETALKNAYKVNPLANKEVPLNKLYHKTNNPNLSLDEIDLLRLGKSQSKKRHLSMLESERPSGFYTSDEAFYPFMGGKSKFSFDFPANAKIKDLKLEGRITDRISQNELKKLQKEGYDLIRGKNMIGQTEYIPLNKSGFDFNFITKPLTPFTKNELTKINGKNMAYRKIGNKSGLQDLINKGGSQAPAPLRMKSGQTADTPFFGMGKTPTESYRGIYAVEADPFNPKYNWSHNVAGTSNYGVAPFDSKTGRLIKNIPIEDLNVYRKKWFSNNYKKLDPNNLEEGLKYADAQYIAENSWKWGVRGLAADQFFNNGEIRKNIIEKTKKQISTLQNKQDNSQWLNKYN